MFIIPFDPRFSQGRWPVVTLIIVALNVLVFFLGQGRDEQHEQHALKYYFISELPKLEIPRYLDDLRQRKQEREAAWMEEAVKADAASAVVRYMQEDGDFMARLNAGQVVRPQEAQHERWSSDRAKFQKLYDKILTPRYLFRPAEPRPVTWLTHMFLHGGLWHLIGNMVVLLIVGVLAEYALGPRLYLLFYLLSGVGAVALFGLLHYGETHGVLGASGAISGVMGLFAILFGMRKVRFFYTLFVYFDFIMLPAIVVLPYWLAWEAIQYFIYAGAGVAYEAHFGGLLTGALLALAVRKRQQTLQRQQQLDRPDEDARWERDYAKAMQLMAALKLDLARPLYERLLAQRPNDRRPLLQLYRVAKFRPESDAYHHYAARLMDLMSRDAAEIKPMAAMLDEYLKLGKPQPRLAPELMIRVVERLATAGDAEHVERLVELLRQNDCRDRRVGEALRQLARRLSPEHAQSYLDIASRYFG